jgi:DNA-binding LytR/AlgR family response regulator
MINAIALDDEPPGLKVIESFCKKVEYIDLIKTFTQPSEALKYIQQFPVDLIFLDIQMPSLSGVEFYKQVMQNTMVIFTTAHSEYAVEGFNLKAIDYLLKPFTLERFNQTVSRAKEHFESRRKSDDPSSNYLFIRADYSLLKVDVNDILFVEGLDDYLKIHLKDQKPIVARMTMKAMLEKLSGKEFIRVHRSYIIPFNKIASVRNKLITLEGKEIPIGVSYEEEFFKRYKT